MVNCLDSLTASADRRFEDDQDLDQGHDLAGDNNSNEDSESKDKAFLVGILEGNLPLKQTPTNRELLSTLLFRNRHDQLPIKKAVLEISRLVANTFNMLRWKIKSHLTELHGAWRGCAFIFFCVIYTKLFYHKQDSSRIKAEQTRHHRMTEKNSC